MINKEDFINAMGMPDKSFTSAEDAVLRHVREMQAELVRKE